jgi:hypothetical protein
MATKLSLSSSHYYIGGSVASSGVVGWDGNKTRVFMVSFTAPNEGANHLSFKFCYPTLYQGSAIPLNFYIGTSDISHKNADNNAESLGTVTMTKQSNNTYIASGEVDILLLPKAVYYLWIFPGCPSTTTGNYMWYRNQDEAAYADGAFGLVRIDTEDGFVSAIPYLDDGTEWKQAVPYSDNGTDWQICS